MISFKKPIALQGVERCRKSELPSEFYSLTNKWQGIVDGQHVTVYAGSMRHDRAKGVLVLRTLPANGRKGGKHCIVPQDRGALEIVESRGGRLRIAMAKGGSFWFEIPPSYLSGVQRHAAPAVGL